MWALVLFGIVLSLLLFVTPFLVGIIFLFKIMFSSCICTWCKCEEHEFDYEDEMLK